MAKKWMVFILVLVLLLALPINAMAARPEVDTQTYLNLGDSIAAGYSAYPGQSYFDAYSEYLEGFGFEGENFAVPGITTTHLLGMLYAPAYAAVQGMVMNADVITVSIGGNNVLQPMIGAMMSEYGIDPMDGTVEELMARIYSGEPETWDTAIENVLANPLLHYLMGQGVEAFNVDWPNIIDRIHTLNPDAHIIVLSIYNPVSKMESPELHQLMEELIQPMNETMREYQGNQVSVANVYNAFRRNEDAVDFSIAWPPSLDPHPTTIGHQLITEELMRVRNPRAFR